MSLTRDKRGAAAVEFAIVGTLLCLVTFCIIEAGLLLWLKAGMQAAASLTARCGAIGYSYNTANFTCTNTSTTQNFAVSTAATWISADVIVASDVTVTGAVTGSACNASNPPPGNYFSVTISHLFTGLPPPLGDYATLTASACYPMK